MPGHTSYDKLRKQMRPEQRAASDRLAKKMLDDLALAELRKHRKITQTELARRMGVKQSTLSKLERQRDMQITTLDRVIRGMGGRLEIIVQMPDATYRLAAPGSSTPRKRSA
jgi:DNA-binding XRE family transcriptional regulator